jgi:hypothetical protein
MKPAEADGNLCFDPEDGCEVSLKHHAFPELHGVTTQKTIFFIFLWPSYIKNDDDNATNTYLS